MNTSICSSNSMLPPEFPLITPDRRELTPSRQLSTKREKMESTGKSTRFEGEDRFLSRRLLKAPVQTRRSLKFASATPRAQSISFNSPLTSTTPNSKASRAYGKADHEAVSVPIESSLYDTSKPGSYFKQCFLIENKLGEGSFGEVFQVSSREDGKRYAVKRTIESYKSSADRALALREVQRHEELSPHPNLVHFYRAWEERGRLYIQTEFCTHSLADYYHYDAPPQHEMWDIFYDVLNAIDYLHSRDCIHLDIKPENIMLTEKKVCKLGDFGLVINLKREKRHPLTTQGDSKYAAPEIRGHGPTQAADVFSVGMTMLEVSTNLDLTGISEHLDALRSRKVPERFLELLDPDLRRLILWMIDPAPEGRPTTQQIINDPAVQWPFLKRKGVVETCQKLSMKSPRFPAMVVDAEKVDVSKTPEQKRQRIEYETTPSDEDSPVVASPLMMSAKRLRTSDLRPLPMLLLDSDSDEDTAESRAMKTAPAAAVIATRSPITPKSNKLGSLRRSRRRPIRESDAPRINNPNFAMLDDVEDPADQESSRDSFCITPSTSLKRPRISAAHS